MSFRSFQDGGLDGEIPNKTEERGKVNRVNGAYRNKDVLWGKNCLEEGGMGYQYIDPQLFHLLLDVLITHQTGVLTLVESIYVAAVVPSLN